MKKITGRTSLFSILLMVAFLPQIATSGMHAPLQQVETGWLVWETGAPIQRLAWDGTTIWAGAYKGGLSQWRLDAGQVAAYSTANGLSGNHVTPIAVDSSSKKWFTLLDGSLDNTVNGGAFVNSRSARVIDPAASLDRRSPLQFRANSPKTLDKISSYVLKSRSQRWTAQKVYPPFSLFTLMPPLAPPAHRDGRLGVLAGSPALPSRTGVPVLAARTVAG